MGVLAATYAAWGKIVEAKAIWAELVAQATLGYMQPFHLAIAASAAVVST